VEQAYLLGCRQLAALKACNRDLLTTVESLRAGVASASSVADAHSLTLRNVLYEQEHLAREIANCRAFPTAELDRIALIPLEQYLAETGGGLEEQGDPPLALHAPRLEHERAARVRMEGELDVAKRRLAALRGDTLAKVALIKSLPALAAAIRSSATPLAQALGRAPAAAEGARTARALGLPRPLYLLFSQLEAAAAAAAVAPPCSAVVLPSATGAGTPAAASAAGVASRTTSRSPVTVAAGDALPVEVPLTTLIEVRTGLYHVPIERARLFAGALGLAAVQPPAKRQRVAGGAGEAGTLSEAGATQAVGLSELLRPHPLAVLLMLSSGEGAGATVRFQYLPLLDVVTAGLDGSYTGAAFHMRRALGELLPGDDGTSVRAWTAALATSSVEGGVARSAAASLFPLASAGHGAPTWAQSLAGIDTLRPGLAAAPAHARPGESGRGLPSTAALVSALRVRLSIALATQKVLSSLTGPGGAAAAFAAAGAGLRSAEGTAALASLASRLTASLALPLATARALGGETLLYLREEVPALAAVLGGAAQALQARAAPSTVAIASAEVFDEAEAEGPSSATLVRVALSLPQPKGSPLAFALLLKLPVGYPEAGIGLSLAPLSHAGRASPPEALAHRCARLASLLSCASMALCPSPASTPSALAFAVLAVQALLPAVMLDAEEGRPSGEGLSAIAWALRGEVLGGRVEGAVLPPLHHADWCVGATLSVGGEEGTLSW
jgi:hypothetical protein